MNSTISDAQWEELVRKLVAQRSVLEAALYEIDGLWQCSYDKEANATLDAIEDIVCRALMIGDYAPTALAAGMDVSDD